MARELLSKQDQEAYGVEHVDFAAAMGWLDDQAYETLDDIEKQIKALLGDDMTLAWFLAQVISGGKAASGIPILRTRLWLGLLATGSPVKLADFTPHVYAVRVEKPAKDDDAVPPSESAESSTTSTDTPPSETSTSI